MVLRNVSDQMLCHVAGHDSEVVRNVAEQVSHVGRFRVRVRNVSGSESEMVPDIGWHGSLLTNVGGQGTNLISL